MITTLLRLLLNVVVPAIAGFFITVQLVLIFGSMFDPGSLAMIPMTGLVTAMLCLVFIGARRLIARRTA